MGARVAGRFELGATYRSELVDRLHAEWNDHGLACSVVMSVQDSTIDTWSGVVAIMEVATTPLLSYRAPAESGPVDAVLVYAFGHRGPDGAREPGPVNRALAHSAAELAHVEGVPVFAQTEPAIVLRELGVEGLTEIELSRRPDGTVIYQSTDDFTRAVASLRNGDGPSFGHVAVVAFADHVGRCVLSARAAGFDAVCSGRAAVVDEYDPESTQPWTRSREAYLPVDLAMRFA